MTSLASFPSRRIGLKILLMTDVLRTINNRSDLVIDGLHSVIDTGHPIVDAGHSIVDIKHLIRDPPHSDINRMSDLQSLCSGHSSLLLCQLV